MKNKHGDFFRNLYQTFVGFDGNLLRRQLLLCNDSSSNATADYQYVNKTLIHNLIHWLMLVSVPLVGGRRSVLRLAQSQSLEISDAPLLPGIRRGLHPQQQWRHFGSTAVTGSPSNTRISLQLVGRSSQFLSIEFSNPQKLEDVKNVERSLPVSAISARLEESRIMFNQSQRSISKRNCWTPFQFKFGKNPRRLSITTEILQNL